MYTGIILCLHPANERWCYCVMPSLIGWAHTLNGPWYTIVHFLEVGHSICLSSYPQCKLSSIYCSESLTHWGRVMHICVDNLTIIGSYNGLSPGWRQAIIWTNAGILLIGPLGTNDSEILIEIQTFSFKKMHLKTSSAKWRPFCLGLNVLTHKHPEMHGLILSTVAADAMVLTHHTTSIHSAD